MSDETRLDTEHSAQEAKKETSGGQERLRADQRQWEAEKAERTSLSDGHPIEAPAITDEVPIHVVPPPSQSRWLRSAKLLLLVLIALTGWNLHRSSNPTTLTSREGEELAARFELYLLAREIDAYRQTRGSLPESVLQVGELGDDVGYTANSDGTFTLSTRVNDRRVLYKQGTEDALYDKMIERIVRGEDQ